MIRLLRSDLGRLRIISLLEGASFLVLLGLAMPLKYLAGRPEMVQVLGRVHGALFILFVLALGQVTVSVPWRISRAVLAFGSSLVPFGALWLEGRLRREMAEEKKAGQGA